MSAEPPLEYIVLDAGALIRGHGMDFFKKAKRIITVPDVLAEIRDSKARELLAKLPYEIEERIPSPASISAVVQFAKQCGNFAALSKTDLRLLALTHMLDQELHGRSSADTITKQEVDRSSAFQVMSTPTSTQQGGTARQTLVATATTTTQSISGSNEAKQPISTTAPWSKLFDGNGSSVPLTTDAMSSICDSLEDAAIDQPEDAGRMHPDHDEPGDGDGDGDGDEHDDEYYDKEEEELEEDGEDDEDYPYEYEYHRDVHFEPEAPAAPLPPPPSVSEAVDMWPSLPPAPAVVTSPAAEEPAAAGKILPPQTANSEVSGPSEPATAPAAQQEEQPSQPSESIINDRDAKGSTISSTSNAKTVSITANPASTTMGDGGGGGGGSRVVRPTGLSSGGGGAVASARESQRMQEEDDGEGWVNTDNLNMHRGSAATSVDLWAGARSKKVARKKKAVHQQQQTTKQDGSPNETALQSGDGAECGCGDAADEDNTGFQVATRKKGAAKSVAAGTAGDAAKKRRPKKNQAQLPRDPAVDDASAATDLASAKVACLTTDFSMQNVLLQMHLHVLSVDGLMVRSAKQWVLRCMGCCEVHFDMDRLFCRRCGGHHLSRVSASIDEGGQLRVHLKKNYRVDLRGSKYSLPAPGRQGRYEGEILLREDQLLGGIWRQKCVKVRKDIKSAFGEDVTSDVGLHVNKGQQIRVGLGKQNPNAAKGRERRGKKKK